MVDKEKERIRMKAWRLKTRERATETQRAWRAANPEKNLAYSRKYRAQDPDKHREQVRSFRASHPGYDKAYYEANKAICHKRSAAYTKKRRKTDVAFRTQCNMRRRLNIALSGAKVGKTLSVSDMLGCSLGRFMEYIAAHFQPGMSWANYGHKTWHLDHRRPIASYNLNNPTELKQAFHWLNYQPLWAKDNLTKSDSFALA